MLAEAGAYGSRFRDDVNEFLLREGAQGFGDGHRIGALITRAGFADFCL